MLAPATPEQKQRQRKDLLAHVFSCVQPLCAYPQCAQMRRKLHGLVPHINSCREAVCNLCRVWQLYQRHLCRAAAEQQQAALEALGAADLENLDQLDPLDQLEGLEAFDKGGGGPPSPRHANRRMPIGAAVVASAPSHAPRGAAARRSAAAAAGSSPKGRSTSRANSTS